MIETSPNISRQSPAIFGKCSETFAWPWESFGKCSEIFGKIVENIVIAAAASEPEANERGSSLISRRLHYRGLQSLFLTKRKGLWLCANGSFRMRSGMHKELWLCANGKI